MMDKEKALDNALAQIEKQFGKGAIMRLGDQSAHMEVSAIPTGCLEVDLALGDRRVAAGPDYRDLWPGILW